MNTINSNNSRPSTDLNGSFSDNQLDNEYLNPGDIGLSSELIAAYNLYSQEVEILRGLRSRLIQRWFNKGQKKLAIVGVNRGDGCTYVVSNLGLVFSQLGKRTLLIDANFREPRLDQLFNIPTRPGLSDILTGRTSILSAINMVPVFKNLFVIPSGSNIHNPQEIIGRHEFSSFLNEIEKNFDVILVDTPAGILFGETQKISAETGAAMLVMRRHHTRISDAVTLKNQLADANSQILGATLNDF